MVRWAKTGVGAKYAPRLIPSSKPAASLSQLGPTAAGTSSSPPAETHHGRRSSSCSSPRPWGRTTPGMRISQRMRRGGSGQRRIFSREIICLSGLVVVTRIGDWCMPRREGI